ncbi:MAG: urease accessory protein UreE [Cyanophyceae cyanobacterium]
MLTLTQLIDDKTSDEEASLTLALTADERTYSRRRFETNHHQVILLRLPRGTVLQNGDILRAETGERVKIVAKPEPVLTVTASPLNLLRTAYHLGNRHVSLEIAPTYLRLSRDLVLKKMLEQLDVRVKEEVVPFHPEPGAYHSH